MEREDTLLESSALPVNALADLAVTYHLRCAIAQMDLLLAATDVDGGLAHLVSMIRHLRAIRADVLPGRSQHRV